VESPVGEFLKAGGGVRCMALRLDAGPAGDAPSWMAAPPGVPLT
jgi:hypothetical protein